MSSYSRKSDQIHAINYEKIDIVIINLTISKVSFEHLIDI
ncbi:MAG: hypothetical protein K0R16_854 [Nitrososphaeraceae archaeon]|jgi:hypothetical protein|nr:hypothetical protein [Nitrososphaeraceae archaeon]MDF2768769.1 hypothetical protein [Nitrososphaeraceae archaeon]